jgi:hypothetical protein
MDERPLSSSIPIRHVEFVIRHIYFLKQCGQGQFWLVKPMTMYKILFLFVVLFALATFSFAIKEEKHNVHVNTHVMTGSPILVLNN